jgi:hypothetical protein
MAKKKFDSKEEEAAEIRTKITFDSLILKKNKKKISPLSLSEKMKMHENCNPYHIIVHLHAFIDVVF